MEVRRGETIASARARCAGLLVRVVGEGDVRERSSRRSPNAGSSFGRTASIDEARDAVRLDVTGCVGTSLARRGPKGRGDRARALALEL